MAGKIHVVQANTVDGLAKGVTNVVGYGYSLVGEPFALGGIACQIVQQGDDQPVSDLEYKVVETNWTSTFEKQLEALLADGWTLYGNPFALGLTTAQAVKKGDIPVVSGGASGGEGGTVTAADITDATTVGRNVLKATDAAAARTAIGAGTSSLAIGTTGTTAKAGNYAPTATEVGTALKAKTQVAALAAVSVADATDATTAAALANANKVAINAVIAALKA